MSKKTDVLKEILQKDSQIHRCSLEQSGPTEEKVCLRYDEDSQKVFFVEKGIRYDEQVFSNENDACLHVISLLYRNKKERQSAISSFYETLIADRDDQVKKTAISDLIAIVASYVAMY